MYNAHTNPYQQYKQQTILTMTQGEMLTQLYDGAIKRLSAAVDMIAEKDYAGANESLQRAQSIFNYLRQVLNRSYSVSDGLDSLYEYFIRCIIQANVRKDSSVIKEIIPMIAELRDTFVAADKAVRTRS